MPVLDISPAPDRPDARCRTRQPLPAIRARRQRRAAPPARRASRPPRRRRLRHHRPRGGELSGDAPHRRRRSPSRPLEDGVFVFHAGTARDGEGRLVTAGGRVLAVSAVAPTVELAQARSLRVRRARALRGQAVPHRHRLARDRAPDQRPVPELPETETIARDLDREIRGRRIIGVVVAKRRRAARRHAGRARRARDRAPHRRGAGAAPSSSCSTSTRGDRIVVQPRFTGALLLDARPLPDARAPLLHPALHPRRRPRPPLPRHPPARHRRADEPGRASPHTRRARHRAS